MLRHSVHLVALALVLGAPNLHAQNVKQQGRPNTLTDAEKAAGWKLLFDGQTTNGWRGYKSQSVPAGWHVTQSGSLRKDTAGVHDIMTTDKYANFDLQLDWKVSPRSNSGIFYRGTEEYDHIYWSAPEYQLLDDKGHVDGKFRLTSSAADYALYPAPRGYVHSAGHWNHARILVDGNHVEHWLNGHKMVSYDLGSPDWQKLVKKSKFAMFPNYGKATTGYIGIQGDEDGAVELRNIKIKVLP